MRLPLLHLVYAAGIAAGVALSSCGPPPPAPAPVTMAPPAPQQPELSEQQGQWPGLVDFVDRVFAQRYAPTAFKQERLGWNRQAEAERLRVLVRSDPQLAVHAMQRGLFALFQALTRRPSRD